jgi:hypothetical protein
LNPAFESRNGPSPGAIQKASLFGRERANIDRNVRREETITGSPISFLSVVAQRDVAVRGPHSDCSAQRRSTIEAHF